METFVMISGSLAGADLVKPVHLVVIDSFPIEEKCYKIMAKVDTRT
jgi:hypothetical protein